MPKKQSAGVVPERERRNYDLRLQNRSGFAAELRKQIALHGETPARVLSAVGPFKDPDTFFIRTVRSSRDPEFTCSGFTTLWKDIVKRHGIYNPYTKRGAIKGLLPHGPHSIRDVIATHMIKQTASYELAAFALHDTPEVMKAHYCRFLPEEKSALAAGVLNRVWTQ